MRQVYGADEKAFVYYAGPKLPVVDRSTGEVRDAVVFVGVLGASNYTFVAVTWSRTLPDWTMSHVRMFDFWGGVPELVIPDNEKSAVRKPRVNIHYHIQAGNALYNVGQALAGREVDVRLSATTVEIFHKHRRVAAHLRIRRKGDTRPTPHTCRPLHRAHAEWTPSRLIA